MFDLLRWPNGDFAFAMGEENPDDVGLAVSADKVVADASARRDSWESLSRLIPSPEVVLTMPVVQPDGAASLAPDEWALLSLIDGERTVGVLVDVSGAGQFTVVSTLASLVQRGLLILRDEDGPDHVTLVRRRQQLLAPLEGGTASDPDQTTAAAQAALAQSQHAQGIPGQAPIVPGANIPATAGGPANPQAPGGGVPTSPAGVPAAPAGPSHEAPAAAAAHAGEPGVLAGAHDPASVVPPRPEPFMPKRVVDHPEPGRAPGFAAPASAGASAPVPVRPVPRHRVPVVQPPVVGVPSASAPQMSGSAAGAASGTAGVATATAPASEAAIERDPTVNRSLMLRLIAGVRGL